MQIRIESVSPVAGSIAQGQGIVVNPGGLNLSPGARVWFFGEYRMLAEIASALDAGEIVESFDVPEWAVTDWEEAA